MYINPTKEHQAKARLAALETFPITTTPGAVQIGDTSAGILVPVGSAKVAVVAAITVKEFAPKGGSRRPDERKAFDLNEAQKRWVECKVQGIDRAKQRIEDYRRKADELEAMVNAAERKVRNQW